MKGELLEKDHNAMSMASIITPMKKKKKNVTEGYNKMVINVMYWLLFYVVIVFPIYFFSFGEVW